jgi:predicted nucleic-acid-binding protein
LNALDTNVLIRFLTNDDEEQAQKVLQLFQVAENYNETFFVPLLVVLELVWVLKAVFNCSKDEVIKALENLMAMPVLVLEQADAVFNSLRDAKTSNYDISDLLIAHTAIANGAEMVFTFDQKAANHVMFELLK